jgi:hypothetical protein
MDLVKPISPEEARSRGRAEKSAVYEIVNDILAKQVDECGTIYIDAEEIIEQLLEKMPNLKRQDVFDRHLLDIEPPYRSLGWRVTYTSPDGGGPGTFAFSEA